MRRSESRSPLVNFARVGDGPPLVLFHGIGHRWQAWEPVLDRLARHHEVVAVDLPGFGESPEPDSGLPADMAATVERVRNLLEHLGLDRPHVAGNSLGGAIALELAAAGHVASATALAPAGFHTLAERRRAHAILRTLRANAYLPASLLRVVLRSKKLVSMTYGLLVVHPEYLSRDRLIGDAVALRRASAFDRVARADLYYQFNGEPAVPVTVAWGDHDRILPPKQALRAQARLPNARHVLLTGCGHVPMSDDPEQVAAVILSTTGAVPKSWQS